ncbi:NUMOD4 domain-containing protein [Chryseobacterium sp.]|uniref:NUMOD4 domain-containing protein n=1 Tax=Chryseobacterium sp. TaxID=1871047 RepID=UPI00289E0129|nr:NUMOD4 domain-containing protein [Chryseobacterium sp.]
MQLPSHLETPYVQGVLYNSSLQNLPDEMWKAVEGFDQYAISNYGRLKSLKRQSPSLFGRERMLPEKIMKLIFVKSFNQYLQKQSYAVHCTLSSDGKKYRKSVARLVYYHFIEKFDYSDRRISIMSKDGDSLHVHQSNLQRMSASEKRKVTFTANRARNRNVIYQQAVSQYTVEGVFVADFDSMYKAAEHIKILPESIMDVIHKEFLTAGGYRWFLKSHIPQQEEFKVQNRRDAEPNILNISLWEKLEKPAIDRENPPPCMNLSLKNLPGEHWKPIPISPYENRFMISDKGRVKRLSGWTTTGRKVFLQEQILSQLLSTEGTQRSLFTILNYQGKQRAITTVKLIYCCFVEQFDLSGKAKVVVNKSNPFWDIDIRQLSLHSIHSVLKGKL